MTVGNITKKLQKCLSIQLICKIDNFLLKVTKVKEQLVREFQSDSLRISGSIVILKWDFTIIN